MECFKVFCVAAIGLASVTASGAGHAVSNSAAYTAAAHRNKRNVVSPGLQGSQAAFADDFGSSLNFGFGQALPAYGDALPVEYPFGFPSDDISTALLQQQQHSSLTHNGFPSVGLDYAANPPAFPLDVSAAGLPFPLRFNVPPSIATMTSAPDNAAAQYPGTVTQPQSVPAQLRSNGVQPAGAVFAVNNGGTDPSPPGVAAGSVRDGNAPRALQPANDGADNGVPRRPAAAADGVAGDARSQVPVVGAVAPPPSADSFQRELVLDLAPPPYSAPSYDYSKSPPAENGFVTITAAVDSRNGPQNAATDPAVNPDNSYGPLAAGPYRDAAPNAHAGNAAGRFDGAAPLRVSFAAAASPSDARPLPTGDTHRESQTSDARGSPVPAAVRPAGNAPNPDGGLYHRSVASQTQDTRFPPADYTLSDFYRDVNDAFGNSNFVSANSYGDSNAVAHSGSFNAPNLFDGSSKLIAGNFNGDTNSVASNSKRESPVVMSSNKNAFPSGTSAPKQYMTMRR